MEREKRGGRYRLKKSEDKDLEIYIIPKVSGETSPKTFKAKLRK